MMGEIIRNFCDIIGYHFNNNTYLEEALTHSSAAGSISDNDRLEFLGDRVLGLIIADRLLGDFPEAETGELARRYNRLVRSESLVTVAEKISIGLYLKLSSSEEGAGGRTKPAILADSCEALIAALYLDGGMIAAKEFIEKYWSSMIVEVEGREKDSKSALQEWAHAHLNSVPTYREVSKIGPAHKPYFKVEVSLPGYEPALGEGESKRKAQQHAATELLSRLRDLEVNIS